MLATKTSKSQLWLLFLLLLTFIQSCDEEVPVFPIIEASLIEATADGALVKVSIDNYPISEALTIGLLWNQAVNDLTFGEALTMELQASEFSNGEATVLITTLSRNINYRFRAFIETDNNTFYSGIVTFLSQGSKTPTLERITPDTGSSGDTISLIVKDFGIDSTANQVGFNESFGEIIERNDSLWKVIVPELSRTDPFFETGEVGVFVTKYNLLSNRLPFELQNLNITGTLPERVKPGELVSLTGEGFVEGNTQVSFDGVQADFNFTSENLIEIYVPSLFESATGSFSVTVGVTTKVTNEVTIDAPTFDASTFDATIGPGKSYTLTGENLDNPQLEILVNGVEASISTRESGQIELDIPGDLCTETVDIAARIRFSQQQLASELPFAQTEITDISVVEAAYGGLIEVSLKHFVSGQNWTAFINGTRVFRESSTGLSNGRITLSYEIPRELLLNDAGDLNFSFEICDKTISQNRFAQIPAPEISRAPTVNPYQVTNITGIGFGGSNKSLYIDGELRELSFTTNNSVNQNTTLRFVMGTLANGTYDVEVEINGRRSNRVSMTVENLWTQLADLSEATSLPDADEIHPVAFLNGDELYVGGGFNDFREFYALDLNSGNWEQKADIPLQIGGSSNNEDAGYLFYQQQLYRYDFVTDSWERLPDQENLNSTSITGYTSFMSDGRFFISPGCLTLYYYDPVVNEWQKIEGDSNSGCSNAVTFTSQTDERYVYNYRTIRNFDPSSLTYIGGWSTGFSELGYSNSSLQGFEYDGNLILIDNHQLTIRAVGGTTYQSFGLPNFMNNPKLFRRGNEAIVVSEGIVWTFDLNAI